MHAFDLLHSHRDVLAARTGQVVLPAPTKHATKTPRQRKQIGAAFGAQLAAFGYAADRALTKAFVALGPRQQQANLEWLLQVLARAKGADVPHVPLFAGFPEDVPDEHDYLVRRIVGWATDHLSPTARAWVMGRLAVDMQPDTGAPVRTLSCGCTVDPILFDLGGFGACPICQRQTAETSANAPQKSRAPLVDDAPLRELTVADERAVHDLAEQWAAAPVTLTAQDAEGLASVLSTAPDELVDRLYRAGIPNRETKARVGASLVRRDASRFGERVALACDTATDALRLASVLSTDDAALVLESKFRLNRAQRRVIVRAFNHLCSTPGGAAAAAEDAARRPRRFVALLHQVHLRAPESGASEAAVQWGQTVREAARTIPTFARRAAAQFEALRAHPRARGVLLDLVATLSERPGEFARRIDAVLRSTRDPSVVLDAFEDVADRVATPVLLSLVAHARTRAHPARSTRLFVPKGPKACLYGVSDERAAIKTVHLERLGSIARTALENRFARAPHLGRVWVDPALRGVPVPAGMGTVTTGLDTLTRGTRQTLPDGTERVRVFAYWKEGPDTGRIDVDLSLTLYDASWNSVGHVAFTRLQEEGFQHSGDIQSAPNGATEYVDIDLNAVRAGRNRVRYATAVVITYTGQTFDTFESQVGIMPRQNTTGEVFEPKTVAARGDLNAPTTQQVGLALDLHTLTWVWLDLSAAKSRMNGAVIHQQEALGLLCKNAFTWADERPTMYDLLACHARGRGTLVDRPDEADVHLGMELAKVTPASVDAWFSDPPESIHTPQRKPKKR